VPEHYELMGAGGVGPPPAGPNFHLRNSQFQSESPIQ
jgi:hypothetical protein